MAMTPLTKVNVGTSNNDGTGDNLRAAMQKVNTAFDNIKTEVDLKVYSSDFAAEVAERDSQHADIVSALADKVNVSDLAAATNTPIFDGTQAITSAQRRQLAQNTGAYVTLMFPIYDAATDVASGSFDLPFLPDGFSIVDMFVTMSKRTVGSGGSFMLAYGLTNDGNTVGGSISTAVDASGKLGSTVVISGYLVVAGKANALTLTVTNTETGSPVAKGLTLWLRGAWANPAG